MDGKEPEQRPTLRLFSAPEVKLATLRIHEAAHQGDVERVRVALDAGDPINGRDDQAFTPLMIAAAHGFRQLFDFLLSAGADPYEGFEEPGHALALAIYAGHTEIVRAWIARGLAEKMYRFCPEIVVQGCGSVEALAREMERTQQFVFWWD